MPKLSLPPAAALRPKAALLPNAPLPPVAALPPKASVPSTVARLLQVAAVVAVVAWGTAGPAGAQSNPSSNPSGTANPSGAPAQGYVPPPPEEPPPPPDYIPPPPPPDDLDAGAAGAPSSPAPSSPAPPDYGGVDQPPPDYGSLPADTAAEAPPAPALGGPPIESGEAYHTRFSGTVERAGRNGPETVIDVDGVVGSIIDLRNLAEPALGQHLISEPQRAPATAADVGQIFGITFDDALSPSIFVTATSAFGLHLTPGTTQWMPGMWGPDAGPGTVYRLSPETGYIPEFFAEITLDGRRNTGPALGNIAYDKRSRQLFVSDLETGMIHRLSVDDGAELGRYDHGVEGRQGFVDAWSGQAMSLAPVPFDPRTAAAIGTCAAGAFDTHPDCWNYADFRRRVWGLAVRGDAARGEVRLYYAVWGSDGFGNPAWGAAGDERRNAVWSVGIRADGAFDTASVRREFLLPGFFEQGPMAGSSRPISDIEFAACGEQRVMLLAERGGARNLGLDREDAFATPHESRVLRYELGDDGAWRPAGRYDVGFYERQEHGAPRLRASSGGGCSFGFGYDDAGAISLERPGEFVWMTGDNLCSPRGACLSPETGELEDTSWVDGLQGVPAGIIEQVLPMAALAPPPSGPATPGDGPSLSYMIDSDVNLGESGDPSLAGVGRNQATYAGDVDVFERCEAGAAAIPLPPDYGLPPLLPPPVHLRDMTHMRNASPMHNVNRSWHERSWSWHGRDQSWHYRNQSWHRRDLSWHWRAASWHSRERSWHSRDRSWHWRERSWHWRNGSWHDIGRSWHNRNLSWHSRAQSWHARDRSWHWRNSSWHDRRNSWHSRDRSWHGRDRSWHDRDRSWHARDRSWHGRAESLRGAHDVRRSRERQHDRGRSVDRDHARQRSLDQHHARQRSLEQHHTRDRSNRRDANGPNVHSRTRSEHRQDAHSRAESQRRDGGGATGHTRAQSQHRQEGGGHSKAESQRKQGGGATAHSRSRSQQRQDGGGHSKAQSQKKQGGGATSHSRSRSQQTQGGGHSKAESRKKQGGGQHPQAQQPKKQGGRAHPPQQHQKQQKQQQKQQKQQKPHGNEQPRHNRNRSQQG